MALIVITGYPFSGKSYRAHQLIAALDEHASPRENNKPPQSSLKIVHIASHHASISPSSPSLADNPRDAIYSSATAEKTARASEIGAIKRALSKDTIVIADSLNYIKGYRYQLWCEAKAAGVRCLTVHTAVPEEDCRQWNRNRRRQWKWDSEDSDEDKTQNGKAGNLKPESHTALYGDKNLQTENEHSDLDAFVDRIKPSEPPEQSLRSLYLHDRTSAQEPPSNALTQQPASPLPANPEIPPSSSSALKIPYPTEAPYSPSTLTALLMRYEPPSPFSRWDTPLFPILPTDPLPPIADIWSAIFPSSTLAATSTRSIPSKVVPHAATVAPKATTSEALQLIERRTNAVLSAVTAWARDHGDEGGEVIVPVEAPVQGRGPAPMEEGEEILKLRVPYGVNVNMAAGQRLRRRYAQMQRGAIAHGQETVGLGRGQVEAGFVRWLEGEWGVDT